MVPCSARPTMNMIGMAKRKITPFCRRPCHICPTPGTSHAAAHKRTSAPGSAEPRARSAVEDFVAIETSIIAQHLDEGPSGGSAQRQPGHSTRHVRERGHAKELES